MVVQASPRKYLLAFCIIQCDFKSKLKPAPVSSLWDSTFMCCCCEKQQRLTVYPINFIFRYLQSRSWMQVWLCRYMNMQRGLYYWPGQECEAHSRGCRRCSFYKSRKQLGQIMLRGDNVLQPSHCQRCSVKWEMEKPLQCFRLGG